MREVVDHSFPPVSTLLKEGGEEFTDFKYWRDDPSLDIDGFVPSDSEGEDDDDEDEGEDPRAYLSRSSTQRPLEDSIIRESIEVETEEDMSKLRIVDSIMSGGSGDSVSGEEEEDDDYVDDYVENTRRTPVRK